MKLTDRERVDGTGVTIGRRVYYRKKQTGDAETRSIVSGCYAAEYRDSDGKQACRNLHTRSRREARRKAIEIQQKLELGIEPTRGTNLTIQDLIARYKQAYEAKGVAPKTEKKYSADLNKLDEYCVAMEIRLVRQFTEDHLCRYRQWLKERGFADKTVEAAVILAKQAFKWAWRQRLLNDYRFSATSFPKAKAQPQPCFTSGQVDALIHAGNQEEKLAFALMGYAGLRIGEVEQLRWDDLHLSGGRFTMIHVRRGGSSGTTKDKDDRFVPVHPVIAALLGQPHRNAATLFANITERQLLKRLKELCETCGFADPQQYKLHSFRHHFASLCANHNVAYRKALAWWGTAHRRCSTCTITCTMRIASGPWKLWPNRGRPGPVTTTRKLHLRAI